MSDFDINAFRNQKQEATENKGKRLDMVLGGLVAVMLVATGGLFAFSKLDLSQAYAENPEPQPVSAELRTTSTLQNNDINKAINSNPMMRLQMKRAQAMAAPIIEAEKQRQTMPIKDFVQAKDLTGANAQVEKYNRTSSILSHCGAGFKDIHGHYVKRNQDRMIKLLKASHTESPMAKSQEELKKIKTPVDAMKFKFSGGADRHMQASMGMMSNMNNMLGGGRKAKSQQECQQVKQLAQTGRLDVRL